MLWLLPQASFWTDLHRELRLGSVHIPGRPELRLLVLHQEPGWDPMCFLLRHLEHSWKPMCLQLATNDANIVVNILVPFSVACTVLLLVIKFVKIFVIKNRAEANVSLHAQYYHS